MPSAPITYKQISPANAYLVRQDIERYDAATNAYIPWTGGAPNVTVGFYTNDDGTGGLAGLTGLPMEEAAGEAGTYIFVVPSALLTPLEALDGTIVYQIVFAGATANLKVVTPLKVTVPRWAQ
jgi:hypothetical protein